jgi:hypothetical protein
VRRSTAPFVVILVSLGFFCTVVLAREGDRSLTLSYVPQESTGAPTPTLDPMMIRRPVDMIFEDARGLDEPSIVGEGTGDDDELFVWRATNTVKEFGRQVCVRLLTGWGVRMEQGADTVLRIRLNRFNVSERDQAVGSMYVAEVQVTGQIEEKNGAALGNGVGAGDARRYGKKRSGRNSIEVLSDALREAVAKLVDDPVLRPAWTGKKTTADAGGAGRVVAPADLLADLVKLKAQGFTSDLLVQFVNQKTLGAALTAEDIVAWKQAGMSETVIRAALERAGNSRGP